MKVEDVRADVAAEFNVFQAAGPYWLGGDVFGKYWASNVDPCQRTSYLRADGVVRVACEDDYGNPSGWFDTLDDLYAAFDLWKAKRCPPN